MDGFLYERIKQADLTKGQRKIAEYILENQYMICQKSLLEVSQEIGVSDASVLRFVRTMGFDGYSDFKEQVYTHLMDRAGINNSEWDSLTLSARLDASSSLRTSDLFSNFLSVSVNVLENSLRKNDPALYQQVSDKIHEADVVYVFGDRGTRSTAEHFAMGLRYIKPRTVLLRHYNELFSSLAGASKNSILIFLCASRYYKADRQVCIAAKDAGIPICLLTNTQFSPISQYAEYLLLAKTNHISFLNSNIGLTALCEYLAILVCQKDEATAKERFENIDVYTEHERIM